MTAEDRLQAALDHFTATVRKTATTQLARNLSANGMDQESAVDHAVSISVAHGLAELNEFGTGPSIDAAHALLVEVNEHELASKLKPHHRAGVR